MYCIYIYIHYVCVDSTYIYIHIYIYVCVVHGQNSLSGHLAPVGTWVVYQSVFQLVPSHQVPGMNFVHRSVSLVWSEPCALEGRLSEAFSGPVAQVAWRTLLGDNLLKEFERLSRTSNASLSTRTFFSSSFNCVPRAPMNKRGLIDMGPTFPLLIADDHRVLGGGRLSLWGLVYVHSPSFRRKSPTRHRSFAASRWMLFREGRCATAAEKRLVPCISLEHVIRRLGCWCPFGGFGGQIDGDSWFIWWFNHLAGKSIYLPQKDTYAPRRLERSLPPPPPLDRRVGVDQNVCGPTIGWKATKNIFLRLFKH